MGKIQKISINPFLEPILTQLYQNNHLEHTKVILFLFHLGEEVKFLKHAMVLHPEKKQKEIIPCNQKTLDYIQNLYKTYTTHNLDNIKNTLQNNWSHYQSDSKKSSLGKYYTPNHLVQMVKKYAHPFLKRHPRAYVLDSCAGYGAFLEAFKEYNIVGRDTDPGACKILKELGYPNIALDNSLLGSHRTKYGFYPQDPLLIVGNPPYNDTTSKNKRGGANKKTAPCVPMDEQLKTKDLGIAFLRHYASLDPQEMVILHPLSYLVKQSNFKKLGEFTQKYCLQSATVFSSKEFGRAIQASTPFPVVCAHYVKGNMDFEHIRSFVFPLLSEKKSLVLNRLYTIDDYDIRKYPPTKNMEKISEIGLYQYNIRDANSLKASGNITTKNTKNAIPIQMENLHQYAYLNAYKRHCNYPYYLGNFSPLCKKELLDDPIFREICIMDFILNNQPTEKRNIVELDITNPGSFLYTKSVMNTLRTNAQKHPLYKAFLDVADKNRPLIEAKKEFKEYFTGIFSILCQDILV